MENNIEAAEYVVENKEVITEQESQKELTDSEVIDKYLSDEFVRKNLIEVMLFYKKKLGSGDWFTLDRLMLKARGAFKAAEVKSHLRLLSLMKLAYIKVDKLNRHLYRFTDSEESRRHILNSELYFHQEKIKSIQKELDTLNNQVKD